MFAPGETFRRRRCLRCRFSTASRWSEVLKTFHSNHLSCGTRFWLFAATTHAYVCLYMRRSNGNESSSLFATWLTSTRFAWSGQLSVLYRNSTFAAIMRPNEEFIFWATLIVFQCCLRLLLSGGYLMAHTSHLCPQFFHFKANTRVRRTSHDCIASEFSSFFLYFFYFFLISRRFLIFDAWCVISSFTIYFHQYSDFVSVRALTGLLMYFCTAK